MNLKIEIIELNDLEDTELINEQLKKLKTNLRNGKSDEDVVPSLKKKEEGKFVLQVDDILIENKKSPMIKNEPEVKPFYSSSNKDLKGKGSESEDIRLKKIYTDTLKKKAFDILEKRTISVDPNKKTNNGLNIFSPTEKAITFNFPKENENNAKQKDVLRSTVFKIDGIKYSSFGNNQVHQCCFEKGKEMENTMELFINHTKSFIEKIITLTQTNFKVLNLLKVTYKWIEECFLKSIMTKTKRKKLLELIPKNKHRR